MVIYTIKNLLLNGRIRRLDDYMFYDKLQTLVEPIKGPEPYTRLKAVRQRQLIGREAFLTLNQAKRAAHDYLDSELLRLKLRIEYTESIKKKIDAQDI